MASGARCHHCRRARPAELGTRWQLAHASPRGGYIVEEVTRTILGTKADGSPITPSAIKYWQAWEVPAGLNAPSDALDSSRIQRRPAVPERTRIRGARFYEGDLTALLLSGKQPLRGQAPIVNNRSKTIHHQRDLPVARAQRSTFEKVPNRTLFRILTTSATITSREKSGSKYEEQT